MDNYGSGEWWIYGEDRNNYYYAGVEPYISMQKANQCENFNKSDYRTWCYVNIPEHDGVP